MDGTDERGSGYSSHVLKVKVVCCRSSDGTKDDDEKSGDASTIRKYGS